MHNLQHEKVIKPTHVPKQKPNLSVTIPEPIAFPKQEVMSEAFANKAPAIDTNTSHVDANMERLTQSFQNFGYHDNQYTACYTPVSTIPPGYTQSIGYVHSPATPNVWEPAIMGQSHDTENSSFDMFIPGGMNMHSPGVPYFHRGSVSMDTQNGGRTTMDSTNMMLNEATNMYSQNPYFYQNMIPMMPNPYVVSMPTSPMPIPRHVYSPINHQSSRRKAKPRRQKVNNKPKHKPTLDKDSYPNNKNKHYRTRLCRHFLRGHCIHGDKCNFLHRSCLGQPDDQIIFLGGLPKGMTSNDLINEMRLAYKMNIINTPEINSAGYTDRVVMETLEDAKTLIRLKRIVLCNREVDIRPYQDKLRSVEQKSMIFIGGLPKGISADRLIKELGTMGIAVLNRPHIGEGYARDVRLRDPQVANNLVRMKQISLFGRPVDIRPFVNVFKQNRYYSRQSRIQSDTETVFKTLLQDRRKAEDTQAAGAPDRNTKSEKIKTSVPRLHTSE